MSNRTMLSRFGAWRTLIRDGRPSLRQRKTRRNRRSDAGCPAAELLESRCLLTTISLTPEEQYFLELVNRARADPPAEATRQGVDLNFGLAPGTITTDPKQPLAPSQILNDVADAHTADMFTRNFFSHTSPAPGSTTFSQRVTNAGYPWNFVGENLALQTYFMPLDAAVVTQQMHDGLWESSGHRENMMDDGFFETGVGIDFDQWTDNGGILGGGFGVTYDTGLTTQVFAAQVVRPYLTGVVFTDASDTSSADNDFFTVGEQAGAGGTVTAINTATLAQYSETIGPSGGYSIQVPAGTYDVTVQGGGLAATYQATGIVVGTANVKVDFETTTASTGALDYGDAPDSAVGTGAGNYNTLTSDNGPSHSVSTSIRMGALIDGDADGQPTATAAGDDDDGSDDEDGLNDPAGDLTLTIGAAPSVDVSVTNITGTPATLYGWIDYNGDGLFSNATERASVAVATGLTGATVTLNFPSVPAGSVSSTFARFRLSTDPAAQNSTGAASDGEVEDYAVTIHANQSLVGRNQATGQWQVARSNGTGFTNEIAGFWSPGVNWIDVATADVNGDGHDDIVGRDGTSGNWWVGLSDGSSFANQNWGFWAPSVTWLDVRIADVNGDGNADIVGRQQTNGAWWVAVSNGVNGFTNQLWGGWTPISWLDVDVADVNGDGYDDIVARQQNNGAWWVAMSNGVDGFSNQLWGGWAPISWVDVNIADVNGDGRDDVVGRQQSNGAWWVAVSDGSSFTNQLWGGWAPIGWSNVAVADVNGDGNVDIVGRQQNNGVWWVALSNGSNGFSNQLWGGWSPAVVWVDLVIADVNGDGLADIFGRQQNDGRIWVARSTGTSFSNELWGLWDSTAVWSDVGIIDELLTS